MENNGLQPIIDLCQSCGQEQAKYIVIEHDEGCCEGCKNDAYRDYYTEPIVERSDTYKCINDAK